MDLVEFAVVCPSFLPSLAAPERESLVTLSPVAHHSPARVCAYV